MPSLARTEACDQSGSSGAKVRYVVDHLHRVRCANRSIALFVRETLNKSVGRESRCCKLLDPKGSFFGNPNARDLFSVFLACFDAGANTLSGLAGNDTYYAARGMGPDTVVENDSTSGNTDVAQFLAGVATDQVWFRQVSNDLEASIVGTADKFFFQNWYSDRQYHVDSSRPPTAARPCSIRRCTTRSMRWLRFRRHRRHRQTCPPTRATTRSDR